MSSTLRLHRAATDQDATERALRVELAACYRLVAHYGLDDIVYTHISARLPGPEHHFLINAFGTMFGEITASSLVKIDCDGKVIAPDGARVNEAGFVIHSAIHLARPDVTCVLHTHTRAGMAVSALADGFMPINQKSLMFYNRLGYHDYEGLAFDTDERARLIADLGPHKAMILANHGLLTCGRDCAEAFSLMYSLELSCRAQLDALASGRPIKLPSPAICEHTARQFELYPLGARDLEWPGLMRMLDRIDPSYKD